MGGGPSSYVNQCPQCKTAIESRTPRPSGTICDKCAEENRSKTAIKCEYCGRLFYTVGKFEVKGGFVNCDKCGDSVRRLQDSGEYKSFRFKSKDGKVFNIIFPKEMQSTIEKQIASSGLAITYQ